MTTRSADSLSLRIILEDSPETVNADPYGAGWMVKINASDVSGLDNLMDSAAYAKYCEDR